jgi:TonB-dependent receptor
VSTSFGRFDFDWDSRWSRTRYRFLGSEGSLVNRLGGIPWRSPTGAIPTTAFNTTPVTNAAGDTGVGWILDRTVSDLYPRFLQNGGLDFANPGYYRPAFNGLSTQAGNLDIDLYKELRGNVRYLLPVDWITAYVKTGFSYRDHTDEHERRNRRWNYLGTDSLSSDPSILLYDKVKTGRNIPTWEGAQFIQNGQPTNPALWQEDVYYYESNRLSQTTKAVEQITGYYGMLQGRVKRFGFLGGLRREITETTAWARVRSRTVASTTEQYFSADPAALARRDYATPFRTQGKYGQNFPSAHTWFDLTPNTKLRASWSTGFARPSLADVLPGLSISETLQQVTIGNPELKPQQAKNWDFLVDVALPHASSFSVGWFHKTIRDYWLTAAQTGTVGTGADNGFNGEYGGFALMQKINGGTAINQGWELSYVQQFRFLPDPLQGLRLNANYTQIASHGNFGGAVYLKDWEIQNFIPRTGNVALSWDYRKFGATVSWNYTSASIRTAYNAAAPSRNQYLAPRDLVNMNLRYQLRPTLSLTLGVANLFNEPMVYFRSVRDQLETFLMQGTTMTAGIEGRF